MRRDLAPSSGRHEQHRGPLMCLPETVAARQSSTESAATHPSLKVDPATLRRRREDGGRRKTLSGECCLQTLSMISRYGPIYQGRALASDPDTYCQDLTLTIIVGIWPLTLTLIVGI